MDYKEMIKAAQAKGFASEKKMWESVALMGKEMECLKRDNPKMYWRIMRKQHGIMYDRHYQAEFADYDVGQLCYTDAKGVKREGPHWTMEQIKEATATQAFPVDVTDYDKYVAYNATYADFCKEFCECEILKMAHLFWFADEDWNNDTACTKIWDYMCTHATLL